MAVRSPLIAASAIFALNPRTVLLACPLHVLLPRSPRFLGAGHHLGHLSHFGVQLRMPYAIVMHIEKTAAAHIIALWNVLAERDDIGRVKFSDEQIRFNYPPHVTLAVVDTVDPDVLVETLKPLAAGWRPLPIAFDSLAVLPRKPFAPMLARPNVTVEILQLHKDVFDALPPNSTSEYHRPRAWQPHVTLARDIPRGKLGEALTALLERWSAFETTLDQVALVYFRQQKTIWHVQEVWRAQL